MRKLVLILCLFFINLSFSQLKDTVIGKVKSIKEELLFLDKNRQNHRLLSIDGDYGHCGFISSKATKHRFYSNWYHSAFVHYLNYAKEFNEIGKPIKEIWYYKDGDTVTVYDYVYDKNDNLIQEKETDPYDNSYKVTNYSYNEYRNNLQSEISYYSDSPEFFSYEYYIYDKKDFSKVIETNYEEVFFNKLPYSFEIGLTNESSLRQNGFEFDSNYSNKGDQNLFKLGDKLYCYTYKSNSLLNGMKIWKMPKIWRQNGVENGIEKKKFLDILTREKISFTIKDMGPFDAIMFYTENYFYYADFPKENNKYGTIIEEIDKLNFIVVKEIEEY